MKLCGVWELTKGWNTETTYSWGKAKEIVNNSIVIDLGEDRPFLYAGPMGESNILKIFKERDKYIIKILFRNNKDYNLDISVIDENTIIFHEMEWFKFIPLLYRYGANFKYYKISGPHIKYYKTKISNLRLRSEPSANGKILRMLDKDEKILILKKGKQETIEGVKGNWVKVLTNKNDIGWCFDSYLERS
jgi:hypothetical protein